MNLHIKILYGSRVYLQTSYPSTMNIQFYGIVRTFFLGTMTLKNGRARIYCSFFFFLFLICFSSCNIKNGQVACTTKKRKMSQKAHITLSKKSHKKILLSLLPNVILYLNLFKFFKGGIYIL